MVLTFYRSDRQSLHEITLDERIQEQNGPVTTIAIAILVDSVGTSLPKLTPVPAPILAMK